MSLRYENGRVFNGEEELFVLTAKQQDELITLLYPNEKTLKTITEERRHQSSWSGSHKFDLDKFEMILKSFEETDCDVEAIVYKWGGVRLYTLYCNKFNFHSAAQDLGITYGAIVKWYQRWKISFKNKHNL